MRLKTPEKPLNLKKTVLVDSEFFSVSYVLFLVVIVVIYCKWVVRTYVAVICSVSVHDKGYQLQ